MIGFGHHPHPPLVFQRVGLGYSLSEVGLQEAAVNPGVHREDIQQVIQGTNKMMMTGQISQHSLGNALALIQLMPLQLLLVSHPAYTLAVLPASSASTDECPILLAA